MDNSQHELSFDEAAQYLLSDEADKKVKMIKDRALSSLVLVINQYLLGLESIAPPFTSLTESERMKLVAVGTEGFCDVMAKMMRMAIIITQRS